jgi:Leucine-rich repeat (LRR) protein
MRRIVLLAIACVLLIGLSLSGCGPAGEPVVTFPDPNLEAAIRETLNKPSEPIYASELAGLASLSAADRGIENLSGLHYCTNLTWLNLGFNQIGNISPLADLTSLEALDLDSNQISDISSLANLTNLTWLFMYSNQISDISPLAGLTNLTWLYLHTNQIGDISSLANLTNLTELYLDSNQISDISSLANLTNLTMLRLGYNQINNIDPLVQNEGLGPGDAVWLDGNPLSSDSINIYIPQLEARGMYVYYQNSGS